MADNFLDTAERMRDSCIFLHKQKHFHNACYMAGYVVECYLKLVGSIGSSVFNPLAVRHNINRMNTELNYRVTSATTLSAIRPYLIDVAVDCPNICAAWDPLKRYEDKSLSWNEALSNEFQIEQEKCFDMINKMAFNSFI